MTNAGHSRFLSQEEVKRLVGNAGAGERVDLHEELAKGLAV